MKRNEEEEDEEEKEGRRRRRRKRRNRRRKRRKSTRTKRGGGEDVQLQMNIFFTFSQLIKKFENTKTTKSQNVESLLLILHVHL